MTTPCFTDLETKMIEAAMTGLHLANMDDSFHAYQSNTYGHFAKVLETITVNRFNQEVYDQALGSLDFDANNWFFVCQLIWKDQQS